MFDTPLAQMTAAELYEAARIKEAEEHQKVQAGLLESLRRLREERKALRMEHRDQIAALRKRHRKESRDLEKAQHEDCADIDKRIGDLETVLQIRSQQPVPQGSSEHPGASPLRPKDILQLMTPGSPYSVSDLRDLAAAAKAAPPRHLAQSLAYFRRQGYVDSPRRGIYVRIDAEMTRAA